MKHRQVACVFFTTVALAGVVTACDNGPTRPSSQNGHISRLELAGPATIAPGEEARYSLAATLTVGGPRDATDEAVWRSSVPSVVGIDKGLAKGLANGEAAITAVVSGRSTTKPVVVTPTGTFQLRGTVMQANSNNPVAGATVEARSPGGDVQSTFTAANGGFVLYGVHPTGSLHVSHALYEGQQQSLTLTAHSTVNVQLAPSTSTPIVAGTYTLTIGSSNCPGASSTIPALAGHMRQRTYTAVLTQSGRNHQVTLSGANFGSRQNGVANRFGGSTQGTRVVLHLWGPDQYYYYYYADQGPDVAERMDDGTYLVYSGVMTLDFEGTGFRGILSGTMRNAAAAVRGALLARCTGSFPVTLSR